MNPVKKLRKQLGITQAEFAFQVGVKQSTIAQYETDKRSITVSTLKNWCDKIGVSFEIIFTLEK